MNINLGFVGLLALIFAAAKVFGYITWSWWWVFSPIWIPFSVALAIFGVVAVFAYIYDITINKGR